ncbi:MAG: hypothetical protein U1E70_25105 [Acetobacteraceae bacterium]
MPVIISWAGMRVRMVTLAAALALPEDFPGRDFVLAGELRFAVILVILVDRWCRARRWVPLIRLLRVDPLRRDGARC